MTSILKVDQLQDSGGNALITSDGAGNLTQGTIPATAIGTGAVVQVVQSGNFSRNVVTSTSDVSLGTLSITPNNTSNKILITCLNHIYVSSYATNNWRGALITVKRDSTTLLTDGTGYGTGAWLDFDSDRYMCYSSLHYLDSPNTTSAITYEVFGQSKSGSSIDFNNSNFGSQGRFILMEIAG